MKSYNFTRSCEIFGVFIYSLSLAILSPVSAASSETPFIEPRGSEPANTAPTLGIIAGPYLQAPTETGVTVVWATSRKCVAKVEYQVEPGGQKQTAMQSEHGLVEANVILHQIRLDGLKPGTCYSYSVISTEIRDFQPYKVIYGDTVRSPEKQFTTLDNRKSYFSFIVLNDRHEKIGTFRRALQAIRLDGVDLVLFNGDMLNDANSETQIFQKIIQPSQGTLAGRIPFIMVRGNHETRGSFARQLLNYFPSTTGRYYFAFSHGGVRFVILDSGEDKTDNSSEYSGLVRFEPYIDEETQWLKREIRSREFRKAHFRVVLSHMPLYPEGEAPFLRQKYLFEHWGPLFDKGKVDLLLSAHTHHYAEAMSLTGAHHYRVLINGTDSFVRVDSARNHLAVTTYKDDGTLKSQLPLIRER